MARETWRMLCASFVDVFPYASLWYCNPEHQCLVGAAEELRIDPLDWQRRIAVAEVHADLAESNFADTGALLTRYLLGDAALREYLAGAQHNTDDRPLIEFSRELPDDERAILAEMLELRSDLREILTARDGSQADRELRADIVRHVEATELLFEGQMVFWYPQPDELLRAQTLYRRALAACPDNQDVRECLAMSDRYRRKVAGERQRYPDNPGPPLAMARFAREDGRLDEAAAALRALVQKHPRLGVARVELALVHVLQGKPRHALPLLRPMAGDGALDAQGLQVFGVALEQAGFEPEARRVLGSLAAETPWADDWWRALTEAHAAVSRQR
jgi:hypothetical protein